MKTLVVGDMHARKNNLDRVRATLEQTRKIAVECNSTVFLGDLFDEKAYLRTEAVNLYLEFFKDWPGKLVLLVGNHDYSNSIECKVHSLEVFKTFCTVVDGPKLDGTSLFLPYTHDNNNVVHTLEQFKDGKKMVIYGHQGVDGCMYSSGTTEISTLKKEHFKGFKKVFMGHIHKPQKFDNIVYVGTPFTKDYGEANEVKRVLIYDDQTDQTQDVFLSISRHIIREFTIETINDLKKIKAELKDLDSTNLKLVINAPESIAKKIKATSFDIPVDSLKVEPIKDKSERTTISETLTTEDMCSEYLKMLGDEVDVDVLVALNNEILTQVRV